MKARKRKFPSKSKRAQAFLESNPAASVNEIAYRFTMTNQSVYALRNKMRKEGFVFPKRGEQLVSLTPTGRALAEAVEGLDRMREQIAAGSAPLEIEMFDFPDQVDVTLDARAVEYGKFIEGAEVMQMLKRVVQAALNNRDKTLAHDQAEAMDMILHKVGRIINGNPDVVDHWLDIAGYAKLVADRLEGRIR
jgi:DNA-binding MarR family transcriptional regulator